MILVLKFSEPYPSWTLHRLLSTAVFLVLLAARSGFSQFDDNDPVFSIEKPAAAPEVDPNPAVDIRDDLRPFMNVELGFIKRICQPTPEQKKKIVAAANACLDALNGIAAPNQQVQMEGFGGGGEIVAVTASGVQLTENPIEKIQRDMAAALRPILSAQQHAAYLKEAEQRLRARREAVVAMTVVLVDQQLILTDQQRKNITLRLLDEWKEAANVPVQMYISNSQYLPELPEAVFRSELDAEQLEIWKSQNQTRFPLYLGSFSTDVWDEDFLK